MQNVEEKSQSQVPTLPDHLIVEDILPRLPVKSLIRFKSVCKYWLSTTTTKDFTKRHLKFSSPQILLHSREQNRFATLSLDESCDNVKELVNLEYSNNGGKSFCVLGSCNGLVCLFIFNGNNLLGHFRLWNPASHCYHDIAGPNGCFLMVIGAGFGYISSIDDYRLAYILINDEDDLINVYLFSSTTGKWEKTDSSSSIPECIRINFPSVPTLINDTLYWPLDLNEENATNYIVGVNLLTGKLSKILLMDPHYPRIPSYYLWCYRTKIFSMKGKLLYCTRPNYRESEVWIQKSDESGWKKLFCFKPSCISLLYLTESGKFLVISSAKQLMLLTKTQMFVRQFDQGISVSGYFDEFSKALEYKESLVSPVLTAAGIGTEL
ncbi:F-box/kelch-repeat protein At3g23880-like [Spinacia oleracea]|uniref:F-box/kelch-repeat protein At3g23880-like n=1 Tax=Spinacia oleracea TaxID=3562 RepID=A0A9R0J7Q0_SPIOL|nr:F-box/kelch-repeat protein At3g23880-like [Spinacia oleracea]